MPNSSNILHAYCTDHSPATMTRSLLLRHTYIEIGPMYYEILLYYSNFIYLLLYKCPLKQIEVFFIGKAKSKVQFKSDHRRVRSISDKSASINHGPKFVKKCNAQVPLWHWHRHGDRWSEGSCRGCHY